MGMSHLMTSQSLYLQILSHWRLGFRHANFAGCGEDTNIQTVAGYVSPSLQLLSMGKYHWVQVTENQINMNQGYGSNSKPSWLPTFG